MTKGIRLKDPIFSMPRTTNEILQWLQTCFDEVMVEASQPLLLCCSYDIFKICICLIIETNEHTYLGRNSIGHIN